MSPFYNQPFGHRMGTVLREQLENGGWTKFDAAVAWVRRSGTRHILPALKAFRDGGHRIRLTVGVDIENTSREGLEDLLDLASAGDCQVFVYHNEAGGTYHPKLYLFRSHDAAMLVVGSSNLTEAGLFTNTEACLAVKVAPGDAVVVDAVAALKSWRDPSENLARQLTAQLIQDLVDHHYVYTERALRRRRKESGERRERGPGAAGAHLFGSKVVSAPAPPQHDVARGTDEDDERDDAPVRPQVAGVLGGIGTALKITNRLLMRIRRARGTQVQIPIRLKRSTFFEGIEEIVSDHDGTHRPISATHPERGGGEVNTYKVEIPESRGMVEPVLCLDRTPTGIIYRVYDANSIQGQPLYKSLEEGFGTVPPSTVLASTAARAKATWYRFI